jgi:hypothetical protein
LLRQPANRVAIFILHQREQLAALRLAQLRGGCNRAEHAQMPQRQNNITQPAHFQRFQHQINDFHIGSGIRAAV